MTPEEKNEVGTVYPELTVISEVLLAIVKHKLKHLEAEPEMLPGNPGKPNPKFKDVRKEHKILALRVLEYHLWQILRFYLGPQGEFVQHLQKMVEADERKAKGLAAKAVAEEKKEDKAIQALGGDPNAGPAPAKPMEPPEHTVDSDLQLLIQLQVVGDHPGMVFFKQVMQKEKAAADKKAKDKKSLEDKAKIPLPPPGSDESGEWDKLKPLLASDEDATKKKEKGSRENLKPLSVELKPAVKKGEAVETKKSPLPAPPEPPKPTFPPVKPGAKPRTPIDVAHFVIVMLTSMIRNNEPYGKRVTGWKEMVVGFRV